MRDLPGGTVTLVFTDIEGSTRLLREHGGAYAELLADHRRTLREIFGRHHGIEVDTQGDGFFFAFSRASDAVAAADAVQQALEGWPAGVRIGVHTGEPTLTREGYVGIAVHTAARVCAAAHGGQTLLTQETRALVQTDVRDLGLHELRDIDRQMKLFQLGTREFPPPRTVGATNLPAPVTPLLEREEDVTCVTRLLTEDRVRLLTVTGPGGIGKTRFSLEVAAEFAARLSDGVWLVDLAPIREPALVLPTVAATVGAKGDAADFLRDRELLLVLDNFEQVTEAAPEVARLLASAPNVLVLATSREPLHVAGELEYALQPLTEQPAVELFRSRARAVRSDFAATFDELAAICQRFEGLPLAIELAAARAKILEPPELIARLDRRLSLLSAGARDAPARQRTLRATIDWSYELLPEIERRVFAQLSTFVGGFTLEAAEQICDAELETIALLVDKNLVRRVDGRFSLLETIREYAAERLADSGESGDLRRRHAAYFVALAERAEPELTGVEQAVWLDRIAREHENLRAALDRLLEDGDRESVLRLASALVLFWYVRGFYSEGVEWLRRAVPSSGESSPALAKALWGAGLLAVLDGDQQSGEAYLDRALSIAREVGDLSSVARTLDVLGLLAFFRNDLATARTSFEKSVELARSVGDTWCLADALGTLSSIYPLQGDLDAANLVGEEALELARRAHDQQGIRMALFGLALTAARRDDLEVARTLATEGLAICREIGDPWFSSYFLWILASADYTDGELAQARLEIDEAVALAHEINAALLLVCGLEVRARLDLADGEIDTARLHLDEALDLAAGGVVPNSYVAAVHLTRSRLARSRGDTPAARRELEQSVELARESGDTWAEALALEAFVALDRQEGAERG